MGRSGTSAMIPHLVPEILPLDAFCDVVVVVVAGNGDSWSWIQYADTKSSARAARIDTIHNVLGC